MLFNSLDYLIFLPLVVMVFYLIPHKYRWVLLLGASYYFYACWRVEYVGLIILSTLIDYWAGLRMSEQREKRDRKKYLYISLAVNLGMLFIFKYYDFFAFNLNTAFDKFNVMQGLPYFELLLPVGISFYTFQTLSYTIDVYNGSGKPERHLGYFAVYVSYFPQLVAGPIERAERLLPQLRKKPEITKDDVRYAVNKILLGFAKKVVVADTIGIYVNQMYGNISGGNGTQLLLASMLFGIQIFCDFSGYTDIAIGSARLMGVRLMENFRRPYWVMSIAEFWSKWHISLTSWIRDYIFVPMVNKNNSNLYVTVALFTVMPIIGFWHGAKWTFIFFGVYQSVFLIGQRLLQPFPFWARIKQFKMVELGYRAWNIGIMLFGIIIFRSQTMHDAFRIYEKIFTDFTLHPASILSAYKFELGMSFFLSLLLGITVFFNSELRFKRNWLYIASMIGIILLLGQDTKNQFIYFQF